MAEVSGDYAGLLRLGAGKNKFGGGHPTVPSLNDGFRFELQEIALIG
jgi:hypothetical protein